MNTRMTATMKVVGLFLMAVALWQGAVAAASTSELDGTWSGNWIVNGEIPDAVTVQLARENGTLTAKFLSPTPMTCTTASFAPKTGRLVLEATDEKLGVHYKLVGKVSDTEIIGTIDTGNKTGTVRLVKWTFFPRAF